MEIKEEIDAHGQCGGRLEINKNQEDRRTSLNETQEIINPRASRHV